MVPGKAVTSTWGLGLHVSVNRPVMMGARGITGGRGKWEGEEGADLGGKGH